MAFVRKNLVTKGLSGKLGDDIVFRQTTAGTVVCASPQKSTTVSEKQLQQQELFKKASQYAKMQMSNPEMKVAYEAIAKKKNFPNGYNVAVADYFKAPVIQRIDTSLYKGGIGDRIVVEAFDDFKVKLVEVSILLADGNLLEQGNAIQQSNEFEWQYTARVENVRIDGCKITVRVLDYPENETVESIDL